MNFYLTNFKLLSIFRRRWLWHAFAFFLFLTTSSTVAFAQVNITGVVKTESGETLPGVTVQIKNSTGGVQTDANGKYAIQAPSGQSVLVFSFIGFTEQEQPVRNRSVINVTLLEARTALQEIVVIGYGTQKRVNMTGAVSTVAGKDLNTRQVPNPTALLQGRMPGVQVTQNSSQPGLENANIQIRGRTTYGGGTALVLIDGIEGDLNRVNPNNIESISVLKDAASSAIYGSRAAAGVILVTTKTGREGRLNVDYTYNFSNQQATAMFERVTNSVQFMELRNKAAAHSGSAAVTAYSAAQIDAYRQGSITNPEQYPNYDWTDAIFSNAPMQQHFVSVNGGKSGTTYNFGLGYLDQEGILIATDFKRYDAQLNLKTNLTGKVTFGTNLSFSRGVRHETAISNGAIDGNTTEDQILSALSAHPMYKPKLPDGSGRYTTKAYVNDTGNKNPIAVAENGGKEIGNYYALASAFMDIDILPGLKGQIKGGIKYDDRALQAMVVGVPTYLYLPDANGVYTINSPTNGAPGTNSLQVRDEKTVNQTYFAHLNYVKAITPNHNINALLGVSQESQRFDRLHGSRLNSPDNNLTELFAFSPSGQTVDGTAFEWSLQSIFGRFNYDFKERILVETSFRYDGSSRFSPGNKWGFFPAASIGWRVSEEPFMKNVNWISNLKPRLSWGQVGNQDINLDVAGVDYPYAYQSYLIPTANPYQIGGSLQQGLFVPGLNNQDITWETTTTTNLGLDFDVLSSKIFGSVDWYTKRTTDILRTLAVPNFIGLGGPSINGGEMKNTGFEFLLGHDNRIKNFHYRVQGNFETYNNKLVKFGTRAINSGAGTIQEEGLPWNSFFLYRFDGIYQNAAEIAAGPTPLSNATKPGDMKYRDLNNDGKITVDDREVVSGAFPKFNYGFSLNADYKRFDVSLFLQGVHGRKILVREWGIAPFRQGSPPPTFWLNAWNGEGTSNTIPAIFYDNYAPNTQVSDWWLQDASYMRLKNIQLGYSIPANLLSKARIQNMRIYLSGDNLVTFTKFFKGMDPERASASGRAAIYPQARLYTFGLKMGL